MEVIAFMIVAGSGILRLKYDHARAKQDLLWVFTLWIFSTPHIQKRWIWKALIVTLSWSICRFYETVWKRNEAKAVNKGRIQTIVQKSVSRERPDDGKDDCYNSEISLKPLLFPCRTSHTRFFPKQHSFSYSYLFVGIPIGWRGYAGTILSADLVAQPGNEKQPGNGWFNVDCVDYLQRGEHARGLYGKLEDYLATQNEDLGNYPCAYLVTAPRFLGYSFNPVSFWYLYNQRKDLKAMILEVNNTFDERRMYFLKSEESDDLESNDNDIPRGVLPSSSEIRNLDPPYKDIVSSKFNASWLKDFHVSPFNSRKGAYSLKAANPFSHHVIDSTLKANGVQVDSTITLSSSKNHSKLVARVFSTADSIDPFSLTLLQALRFVISWCWVGFVTFPRIVREAGKLFFLRKLHVWYRPEVLKDSIGRNDTGDERAIAMLFRDYIKFLVEESDLTPPAQFMSSITTMPSSETFYPRSFTATKPLPESSPDYSNSTKPTTDNSPLTFKVTTPLFYALLARQNNIYNFLADSFSNFDPKTATFYTSDQDLLLRLFKSSSIRPQAKQKTSSFVDLYRWRILSWIRKSHSPSPLDAFALLSDSITHEKVRAYRISLLKILVADRLAFGSPGLIDSLLWIIRVCLTWVCAKSLERLLWMQIGYGDDLELRDIGKVFVGCMGLQIWSSSAVLL